MALGKHTQGKHPVQGTGCTGYLTKFMAMWQILQHKVDNKIHSDKAQPMKSLRREFSSFFSTSTLHYLLK